MPEDKTLIFHVQPDAYVTTPKIENSSDTLSVRACIICGALVLWRNQVLHVEYHSKRGEL
jgi:hypothetical protein